MTGSNEGSPDGMPSSYSQYAKPVLSQGNNANGQSALEYWLDVATGQGGNSSSNTLVNIKLAGLYFLNSSTGQWTSATYTINNIGSDMFNGAFTKDYNQPGNVTTQSDGTFAVSTASGITTEFFADNRMAINPNAVGGIVAIFAARLIVANPNLPDDRATSNYVATTGADYYPSTSGPGIENNPGVGDGKIKKVTVNWRSFAMTTMSQAQLSANPPPINLTGISP